jgi:membrane associated rhomboid family serine protease
MNSTRPASGFAFPNPATTLLIAANVLVFALTLQLSGSLTPNSNVLLRFGANYSGTLAREEYWRLIACGFLHANIAHIGTNMLCLLWWGGPLEKRIGTAYFLLIYFVSVIAGSLTGILVHPGPYLSVGASGGISGILGALLCLKLFGRVGLPMSFFVNNFGINIATTFIAPTVDWGAHLGGLIGGMAACTLLHVFELAGPALMRCKLPEFVKVNLGILFAIVAWMSDFSPTPVIAALAVLIVAVKVIDILLSLPRGLAFAVAILTAGNAWAAAAVGAATLPVPNDAIAWLANLVPSAGSQLRSLNDMASSAPAVATLIVIGVVLMLTQFVYWPQLKRGLNDDAGFVAAGFRGERARTRGL